MCISGEHKWVLKKDSFSENITYALEILGLIVLLTVFSPLIIVASVFYFFNKPKKGKTHGIPRSR